MLFVRFHKKLRTRKSFKILGYSYKKSNVQKMSSSESHIVQIESPSGKNSKSFVFHWSHRTAKVSDTRDNFEPKTNETPLIDKSPKETNSKPDASYNSLANNAFDNRRSVSLLPPNQIENNTQQPPCDGSTSKDFAAQNSSDSPESTQNQLLSPMLILDNQIYQDSPLSKDKSSLASSSKENSENGGASEISTSQNKTLSKYKGPILKIPSSDTKHETQEPATPSHMEDSPEISSPLVTKKQPHSPSRFRRNQPKSRTFNGKPTLLRAISHLSNLDASDVSESEDADGPRKTKILTPGSFRRLKHIHHHRSQTICVNRTASRDNQEDDSGSGEGFASHLRHSFRDYSIKNFIKRKRANSDPSHRSRNEETEEQDRPIEEDLRYNYWLQLVRHDKRRGSLVSENVVSINANEDILSATNHPHVVDNDEDDDDAIGGSPWSSPVVKFRSQTRKRETLSTCENASGRPLGSQSIRGNGANEKSADRIVINVGGTRHETFRSTLRVYPDTRLGWLSIDGSDVSDAFDPVLNEYFFDRHPTAFNQIMNFYRTGKLHTPADICGPLFEEELNFWGLDEKAMEPCCWPKYTEHRDAQENLKVFDSPLLNNQHDDDEIEQPAISVSRIPNYKEPEDQGFKSRFLKVFRPSYFNSIRWLSKKKLIWAVMEGHSERRPMLSKGVGFISLMFIVLSVLSLFFHSMLLVISDKAESNHELFTYLLLALDYLTFAWMSIELIIRFVSSPNRIQFLISFYTIVDLLTLITYALQFNHGMDYHRTKDGVIDSNSITTDYKNIEMFSIVRLVRLVRFFRLSVGLQIFKHTIIASSRELLLLVLLLLLPVALFATIVYFFERETNTGKFRTIPESIWWAVITITTVGYGDMSPETTLGKIFGIICAVFSVFILALPVSIIGTNFTLFYNYAQARMKLPKRPKLALVGAANALRADTSQHSLSPEPGESEAEGGDTNSQDGEEAVPKIDLPKINLGSDPDFNANITSKRFRRERLSLFASGPTRQSTRRSKSVGNSVASKIRQRQRNGTSASQKCKGSTPSSEDEVSEAESEKIEVFKPVKRDNDNSVTNSFDNEAFEHNNEKQVEMATEVTENGHTNQNKKIINNTENDKETKDLDSNKFQKPLDDEKRERLPPINGGPVPIIETILTNTDNTDQNLTTGPIVNGHGPPILKEPVMNNRNSFKKISSPPVLRKICGNGLEPVRKSNGMAVPVEEVESPELFRRKYSNNHLYVPTDGC